MLLKNDAIHTQIRVDAARADDTKVAVANFYGTAEPATELANELAAEPYVECVGRGRKLFFFEKIWLKDVLKRREIEHEKSK